MRSTLVQQYGINSSIYQSDKPWLVLIGFTASSSLFHLPNIPKRCSKNNSWSYNKQQQIVIDTMIICLIAGPQHLFDRNNLNSSISFFALCCWINYLVPWCEKKPITISFFFSESAYRTLNAKRLRIGSQATLIKSQQGPSILIGRLAGD